MLHLLVQQTGNGWASRELHLIVGSKFAIIDTWMQRLSWVSNPLFYLMTLESLDQ